MSATSIRDTIEACDLSAPSALVGLAEQEEVLFQALQDLSPYGRPDGFDGIHTHAEYQGPNPVPDLLAGLAQGTTSPAEVHEALWDRAIKNAAAGGVWAEAKRRMVDIEAKAESILEDNLDSLIEQARPGFEKAVSELAEVVSVLGPDPSADDVMALTGKKRQVANQAWDRRVGVEDAVKKAASIVTLVEQRRGPGDCRVAWYLTTDTEPARVLEAEEYLGGYRYDFPRLVAAEFSLTLNTPDEAVMVAEALQRGKAEQEEAERQALIAKEKALRDANRERGWK